MGRPILPRPITPTRSIAASSRWLVPQTVCSLTVRFKGMRPLNCMQFGGLRAVAAGRLMIVGSFDRGPTENAHDHDAGAASGGRDEGRSMIVSGSGHIA